MSNFQEFIENVRNGNVEGIMYQPKRCTPCGESLQEALRFAHVLIPLRFAGDEQTAEPVLAMYVHNQDHLCAHIRRWLTWMGYSRNLRSNDLCIGWTDANGRHRKWFCEGSELDWHVDAANWVCKQGVEG
jgi:hypothetical protein